MGKAVLVLNVRGTINAPERVRRTLQLLRVPRRYMASLIPDTPSYRGMLKKAVSRIAWCSADTELVKLLLERRGRVLGGSLNEEAIKRMGFSSLEELAGALVEDPGLMKRLNGLKPYFRLAPPRGGFKLSTKRKASEGGVLGENPRLPKLVERMV